MVDWIVNQHLIKKCDCSCGADCHLQLGDERKEIIWNTTHSVGLKDGRVFSTIHSSFYVCTPPPDVKCINALGFSLIFHFTADSRDKWRKKAWPLHKGGAQGTKQRNIWHFPSWPSLGLLTEHFACSWDFHLKNIFLSAFMGCMIVRIHGVNKYFSSTSTCWVPVQTVRHFPSRSFPCNNLSWVNRLWCDGPYVCLLRCLCKYDIQQRQAHRETTRGGGGGGGGGVGEKAALQHRDGYTALTGPPVAMETIQRLLT